MMPNLAALPDLATIGFGRLTVTAGGAIGFSTAGSVAGPTTPATPG